MKPNPFMAAVFAIILLLTLVVMLRSVLGAPQSHEATPHDKEGSHEVTSEEHSIPEAEPAH